MSVVELISYITDTGSFDLIKAGATQTETSLLKQYVAGERVDLLDDYEMTFPTKISSVTVTSRRAPLIMVS